MFYQPASLLDEAHEGSNAGSRADHNNWVAGFERQAELGLADIHWHAGFMAVICHQFILEPIGGHSLVEAASLGGVLQHHSADVDAVGVHLPEDEREVITVQHVSFHTIETIHTHCFCVWRSQRSPDLGGGGDGVVACLQAGHELTQVVDGRAQGWKVLKNGQDVPTGIKHPILVQTLNTYKTGL